MTLHDHNKKVYEIVCYHCSSQQNYTLKDINNLPKRPKKVCSNCGKTIYMEIRIDKGQIKIDPIKDPVIEDLSEELKKIKTSKVYTKSPLKESFHESHFLELIQKYPELPLFMYSKLYEKISKEYKITANLSYNEMEALGIDYDEEFKKLNYSFYDMYMELFEEINKGKHNREIEEYMKDVLHSYGTMYCNERYNLPFDKAKLEEVSYWSEKKAKEHVDKMINIENPKDALEHNWSEDKLRKINEWTINHAKSMVEDGIYEVDYSDVVTEVSEAIVDCIGKIVNVLGMAESLTLDYVRLISLIHLMYDYRPFNIFDDRPNEYIRGDILKLYIEMGRKKIPLDYIPCAIDYQDSIDDIYGMYREYDHRWFGMNDPEKFLQYTSDPTKEEATNQLL